MTFEEALNKLGLSDGASAEETKRAYHKLLKVNKPEVDRDAFIALREAYDSVRLTLAVRARLAASPVAPGAASVAEVEPPVPARPVAEAPAPSPSAPGKAPADETAPSADEERFAKLVERRDYRGAAKMLCESFDRFADRPTILPPVVVTLQTMLACHATNQVSAAQALEQRFAVWLERSGLETSLDPQAIAMWAIARELTALAGSIPADVRAPIAEAALEGDLGKARFRVATLSVEHPAAAATVLGQLKKKAPTLAAALGDVFSAPRPAPVPRPVRPSSGWGKYWGLAIVATSLMRLCSSLPNDHPRPPPAPAWQSSEYAPPRRVDPAKVDEATLERISNATAPEEDLRRTLASVLQLADAAVQTAKRCNVPVVGLHAALVETGVRKGNCPMARASMSMVLDTTAALSEKEQVCVRDAVERLDGKVRKVCPDEPQGTSRRAR